MALRIGILGLGTVGGGVVKLLRERREEWRAIMGSDLEIARVCSRQARRLGELALDPKTYTADIGEFLKTPLDIVVEATGAVDLADALLSVLDRGACVVTANKALLSAHGRRLIGSKNGDRLFFEASCLGGIPIISAFEEGLLANRVGLMLGLCNGTCNYILTLMTHKGVSFADALRAAREKGYAEADPSFDVEGVDATQKLGLLASLAFQRCFPYGIVERQGIGRIEPADFAWARANHYRIKLVSMAEKLGEDRFFLGTFPALIPDAHPLAHVDGVNNAILVRGHAVGDLMWSGPGAGELPTASAMVSDVLAAAQGQRRRLSHRVFGAAREVGANDASRLFSCYMRLITFDQAGILAQLCREFAERGLSLRFVHQELQDEGTAELQFVTHPHARGALDETLAAMEAKKLLAKPPLVLRVLDLTA